MTIGEKLLNLRKEKHLSQEEVAEELGVTRQTISKWETDGSTPDFDKIAPLCKLYGITADELLTGKKGTHDDTPKEEDRIDKKKRGTGIALGVLFYFLSVIWIMITIPVFNMNPIVSTSVFLAFCGIGTYIIIYTNMAYGVKEKKKEKEEKEPKMLKQIKTIIEMITLVIYLYISFVTFAWHITWILWIVAALIEEIIKLFFMLGGENNEK